MEASTRSRAVVFFPGSFNPIQQSHIGAANLAAKLVQTHGDLKLDLHSVRLSPVGDAYGKKDLWPAAERLKLATLALEEAADQGGAALVLDTWEADQEEYLRTYQVADHLAECFKVGGEAHYIFLLAGADLVEGMFAIEATPSIPRPWSADTVGQAVASLDGFIIIGRLGSEQWTGDAVRERLREKLEGRAGLVEKVNSLVVITGTEEVGDGSSTRVRELIASGLDTQERREQLTSLVGPAVQGEILKRNEFFRSLVV